MTDTPFKESDAGDGTVREDHYLHGSKLALCAFSIMLCVFLVALDQLIVSATLTTILDRFNAFKQMNWLLAAYLIPMGGCAQTWGRVSISFGRKSVMIVAIILFEIGSVIAAVAQNINVFIVGRTIQGMGGSGIQTLAMVLMTEISTVDKRPLLLGCMAIAFVAASVLGPIVGGLFTTYVTWRWCFYINLCCGGVVFPLFVFTYKTRSPVGSFRERLKTINFLDNFLMIAAVVLLCLGISFGETDGWKSVSTISSLVIGGVLTVAFGIYNFGFASYPAIPPEIVKIPTMIPTMLSFSLCYTTCLVIMQYLSIYFQVVANHNALHTGISLLPVAVPMTLVSLASAIAIKVTGYIKPISVISAVLLPIGAGVMVLLPLRENLGYSIGFQILLGIAVGLGFQAPLMSGLITAPKTPGSTILTTAFFNTGRSVFCAIFSLLSGVVYTETFKSGLRQVAPSLHTRIDVESVTSNVGLIAQLDAHDVELVMSKLLVGLHNALWMGVALALVSFFATIFMSNVNMPKKVEGATQKDEESTGSGELVEKMDD